MFGQVVKNPQINVKVGSSLTVPLTGSLIISLSMEREDPMAMNESKEGLPIKQANQSTGPGHGTLRLSQYQCSQEVALHQEGILGIKDSTRIGGTNLREGTLCFTPFVDGNFLFSSL